MRPGDILFIAVVIFVGFGMFSCMRSCDKRLDVKLKAREAEVAKKQALICQKVYPQLTFEDCVYVLSK